VVFQLYTQMADLIAGLDEGAAHIVRPDDAQFEWNPRLLRIADGRGHPGIGHWDDQIGLNRAFDRELCANRLADAVDRRSLDDRIGAREINMLEDAGAGVHL